MVGFDETVMQPARRRRFVTAVVDVGTGQILDVFEGRDAKDLRSWMAAMPAGWLAQIQVVSAAWITSPVSAPRRRSVWMRPRSWPPPPTVSGCW
jgi:transposase